MKKALCFQCKQWSSDANICEYCEYIIHQAEKDKIKQKEEDKINPPKPPSFLSRAMDYLKTSKNLLFRLLYYILMSIWGIYVGIVMLILYIIASVVA